MAFEEYFKLGLSVGAILIFLMAIFLWFFPRSFFANKVLAILIFLWGITVLSFVIQSRSFYVRFPHIYGTTSAFILMFFPLMYLYIKTYLYKDARNFKNIIIHCIPFIIRIIAFIPFYILSADEKIEIITEGSTPWLDNLFRLNDIVIILQGVIYTVLSMRILYHFQYFRERRLTKVQNNAVYWLKQFVVINVFLWATGVSGAVFYMLKIDVPFDLFNIYYLGLTGLTLWMGYFTLKKPHLFSEGQSIKTIATVKNEDQEEEVDSKIKEDLEKLVSYLDESKPYLNNEMNLQHLSEGTELTKHRISEVINKALNKTFYDVINMYRTNEAIRLMNEGFHKQHTLTSLAEMAGFNSKATFNRIFKKNTGKTPSEFIKSIE
ncbi:helix-turn-helix domain-containing protein [Carboxylicivirga sp. RSCT41]|uniref:helix-turn-helix domain-containing protein n=1 Tax=Carboxylicivirga agarovorans TaxID=3417570 RepID=UPI003D34342F